MKFCLILCVAFLNFQFSVQEGYQGTHVYHDGDENHEHNPLPSDVEQISRSREKRPKHTTANPVYDNQKSDENRNYDNEQSSANGSKTTEHSNTIFNTTPRPIDEKHENPSINGQQFENPATNTGKPEKPSTSGQVHKKPVTDYAKPEKSATSGQQYENSATDVGMLENPKTSGQGDQKPVTNGIQSEKTPTSGQQYGNPTTNNATPEKPTTSGQQYENSATDVCTCENSTSDEKPVTNGMQSEKPSTSGQQYENPATNDVKPEKPTASGQQHEQSVTGVGKPEKSTTSGEEHEKPVTTGVQPEKPATSGQHHDNSATTNTNVVSDPKTGKIYGTYPEAYEGVTGKQYQNASSSTGGNIDIGKIGQIDSQDKKTDGLEHGQRQSIYEDYVSAYENITGKHYEGSATKDTGSNESAGELEHGQTQKICDNHTTASEEITGKHYEGSQSNNNSSTPDKIPGNNSQRDPSSANHGGSYIECSPGHTMCQVKRYDSEVNKDKHQTSNPGHSYKIPGGISVTVQDSTMIYLPARTVVQKLPCPPVKSSPPSNEKSTTENNNKESRETESENGLDHGPNQKLYDRYTTAYEKITGKKYEGAERPYDRTNSVVQV